MAYATNTASTPAPTLASLGFADAAPSTFDRLLISVSGLEGSGKTSFGLSSTGPIAYFNADRNEEGVIDQFIGEKRIHKFTLAKAYEEEAAIKEWERYKDAYKYAINAPLSEVRSIVADTNTELWELIRLARLGKLSQVKPIFYTPVNLEFHSLIFMARDSNKNLILLHKMKPIYINDKRTREVEMTGFKDTLFAMQVVTTIWKDEITWDSEGRKNLGDFHLRVDKCTINRQLEGDVLSGPFCNFPMLAAAVTNTDPTKWE